MWFKSLNVLSRRFALSQRSDNVKEGDDFSVHSRRELLTYLTAHRVSRFCVDPERWLCILHEMFVTCISLVIVDMVCMLQLTVEHKNSTNEQRPLDIKNINSLRMRLQILNCIEKINLLLLLWLDCIP